MTKAKVPAHNESTYICIQTYIQHCQDCLSMYSIVLIGDSNELPLRFEEQIGRCIFHSLVFS